MRALDAAVAVGLAGREREELARGRERERELGRARGPDRERGRAARRACEGGAL